MTRTLFPIPSIQAERLCRQCERSSAHYAPTSESHLTSLPGRRTSARGIASIEAVLFLPLLILIFAGIQFVTHSNMALMQARSQARSCAWQIAALGCEKVPAECTSERGEATTSASAKERLEKSGAMADIGDSPAVQDEITNRLDGLLVERTTSSASVSYRRSSLLLSEEERNSSQDPTLAEHTAEYRLPCNSIPSDAKNLAEAVWQELGI